MGTFCCRICGVIELKTGRNQKVCLSEDCQREDSRLRTQEYRRRKAKKEGRLDRVDIGRGGGQPSGKDSKHYKTGIAQFHKLAPVIRKERRYCNRCNKDLLEVGKDEWMTAFSFTAKPKTTTHLTNSNASKVLLLWAGRKHFVTAFTPIYFRNSY